MEVLLFPLVFLGIVFTAIYLITQKQYQTITQNFQILADKLQLRLDVPELNFWQKLFVSRYPELNGLFEERYNLRIYMYSTGSGKSKKIYTGFSISCSNSKRRSLMLSREGVFQKIGKAIGMQKDIELRDEEFDSRYILKSSDSLFVKELFADPDLREFFIKYDYAFVMGRLNLMNDSLEFQRTGILNTDYERKRIVVAIRLAVKIAERLEEME